VVEFCRVHRPCTSHQGTFGLLMAATYPWLVGVLGPTGSWPPHLLRRCGARQGLKRWAILGAHRLSIANWSNVDMEACCERCEWLSWWLRDSDSTDVSVRFNARAKVPCSIANCFLSSHLGPGIRSHHHLFIVFLTLVRLVVLLSGDIHFC